MRVAAGVGGDDLGEVGEERSVLRRRQVIEAERSRSMRAFAVLGLGAE